MLIWRYSSEENAIIKYATQRHMLPVRRTGVYWRTECGLDVEKRCGACEDVEREILKEICGPLMLETWQRRWLCECREMAALNLLKRSDFYMHHMKQNF